MFPNTSHNSLPGTRGSRHNLDKGTLHKLEVKGPRIIWRNRTFAQLEKEGPRIKFGGESRAIRISSRNNERSNRTNGNNGRFNRHLRIGFVSNLILFTREITTSFGYTIKIQNPSRYFNVSGNIIK